MIRLFTIAAVLAAMTAPVFGQALNMLGGRDKPRLTEEEVAKQKAAEEAYKAGLSKIPDAKAKSDPWGTVRASGPETAKKK